MSFKVLHASMFAIFATAGNIDARAADVTAYSVGKGQIFNQLSASVPTPSGFAFRAIVEGNVDAITGASILPPGGFFAFPLDQADTRYEFEQTLPDLQTIQLLFGNGPYGFTIETETDIELAQLSLDNTTFPTVVPHISNFAEAQSIDPDASFNLTFNGLGDAQRFRFAIQLDDGTWFVQEGTGTSVTIPAGTLETDSSYFASLAFVKELDRDTTSIVGATGVAELYNATEFFIETSGDGGGGGGEDTTPPILFMTTPANGATGVGINSTISFSFIEAMADTHSIQWSANVNPALFTYTWTGGGRTLVATYSENLPANATITWRLNPTAGDPSNFKDLAGNELPVGIFQGSFTTGSGTTDPNDPCNPNPVDDGRGFGSVAKLAYYVQSGNNDPVPDTELVAMLSGTYKGASNHTVTAVSLSGEGGNRTFQSFAGFYLLSQQFSSVTALDSAVPAGSYTLNATGAGSATVSLGNITAIPVPKINNLTALQSMNVANPFTLQFAPFTGATGSDSISISISGATGDGEFHAPDLCKNIELPVTATSIVIPANTFKAGKTFTGSITFGRSLTMDTNSINGTAVTSGMTVTTQFEFTTGGGDPLPTAPRWTSTRRNDDGSVTFVLTGTPNSSVTIEGTADLATWTPETTATIGANGTYEFTVNPALQHHRAYRARAQ